MIIVKKIKLYYYTIGENYFYNYKIKHKPYLFVEMYMDFDI